MSAIDRVGGTALALASDLLGLAVEVDEDVDLGLQDERLDRLEDVVDRARRVAAEDLQVVLVEPRSGR